MANPVEVGQLAQIAFIAETTFGTTPTAPTGQILRHTSFSLMPDAQFIDNPELRTDGMKAVGRRGALRGKGDLSGKLSYGTYDWFIAAALGGDWVSNVAKVVPIVVSSAASIDIASAGKTFTRATGSFIDDGFVAGQTVQTGGDGTNAGNNATFILTTVGALVLTMSGATGLVNATVAGFDILVSRRPSATIETGFLTNGNYFPFKGCVVGGFEMSGKIHDNVDIKFPLLVKSTSNEAATTLFSALTAVNTNPLITTWEGTIKKDTVALGQVVGWTLKADRQLDVADVCGASDLYDIQPKTTRITGSLELWFDSIDLYTAFRAETDLALQFNLGGVSSKGYNIDLTKVRITKWGTTPKEGMMTTTVEFESFAPDSTANTSCKITRLP